MSQQRVTVGRFPATHVYLLAICWIAIPFVATADEQDERLDQSDRVASLQRLREKANEFVISRVGNPEEHPDLRAAPLLRYTDPPNGYRDAAVWVWQLDGYPVVLAKVEDRELPSTWQFCVASLAPDEILVTRPSQKPWQSKGPGVTFQQIADVPAGIENPSIRLRLMKSLAKCFGGKFESGGSDNREQLRPLTYPILRFSSPKTGVIDGTIFAFAVSGTNPTALVVIVLRDDDGEASDRHWEFGVVGMTADAASIYFDEHLAWSKKADYTKRFYDNWYFTLQPREEP